LRAQTLPLADWELLVVDNGSREAIASSFDLSWHPNGRHIREETVGLTSARLRGIAESTGELLIFVDDDNVLARDYLERAIGMTVRFPFLGAFGAGNLDPEFEQRPSMSVRSRLNLLPIRSCAHAIWTNNPADWRSIPWGAGLCVVRAVADAYPRFVARLPISFVLDRCGDDLFAGGDDLFSWAAAAADRGFGIFPELRVTHLIPAERVTETYLLQLTGDHAFSHAVLGYALGSAPAAAISWTDGLRALLHGARFGIFSMRCRWAELTGRDRAARLLHERNLSQVPAETIS
jgi:glycosyltransferase involved in cell wall biosynthesis